MVRSLELGLEAYPRLLFPMLVVIGAVPFSLRLIPIFDRLFLLEEIKIAVDQQLVCVLELPFCFRDYFGLAHANAFDPLRF